MRRFECFELAPSHLEALLDNQIAAIHIPGVATEQECAAMVAAADRETFLYSPLQSPPIGRIGITQYSHSKETPERYFAARDEAFAPMKRIFERSFDPVERIISRLQAVSSAPVEVAHSDTYGTYPAGLIRIIHEYAGLHFDYVPIEGAGWSIHDIDAQLSWNLSLSLADDGGACVVYDRMCMLAHEQAKADPGDLLAAPALVEGRAKRPLRYPVGDVVLFNTRNYHEILQCEGGRRITVSSFIGRKPDKRLVLWS